ncbi:MAG: hypothetical protein QNJ97_28690 [Myxococcota bacterium]|nr:hypothetical protein [Myxococcota bacterium]
MDSMFGVEWKSFGAPGVYAIDDDECAPGQCEYRHFLDVRAVVEVLTEPVDLLGDVPFDEIPEADLVRLGEQVGRSQTIAELLGAMMRREQPRPSTAEETEAIRRERRR